MPKINPNDYREKNSISKSKERMRESKKIKKMKKYD